MQEPPTNVISPSPTQAGLCHLLSLPTGCPLFWVSFHFWPQLDRTIHMASSTFLNFLSLYFLQYTVCLRSFDPFEKKVTLYTWSRLLGQTLLFHYFDRIYETKIICEDSRLIIVRAIPLPFNNWEGRLGPRLHETSLLSCVASCIISLSFSIGYPWVDLPRAGSI